MAIDTTTQLVLVMYEYLYNVGNRLERDYIETVDKYYNEMFRRFPERHVHSDNLLNLIESKARFEEFQRIQKEIYELLQLYKPGSVNNPENGKN